MLRYPALQIFPLAFEIRLIARSDDAVPPSDNPTGAARNARHRLLSVAWRPASSWSSLPSPGVEMMTSV